MVYVVESPPVHPVQSLNQESVVLARWMETICLDAASKNPANQHAQLLGFYRPSVSCINSVSAKTLWYVRMRAAVFVNLVMMRRAMSSRENGHLSLSPRNLDVLRKANYLFHSAHN